jgi:hypothetical protein
MSICVNVVLNFPKKPNLTPGVRLMPPPAQRSNKYMQVPAQYNEVGGNDAQPDFHRERRLIAVPSLLEEKDAPEFGTAE